MPHLNYMLLAWGTKCHKIELLQKRAVRLLYCKSPIAYTKPLFKRMKQPILSDLYTCQLLKLYYKLYTETDYHLISKCFYKNTELIVTI